MANPKYGTTVADTVLPIQVDKKVKRFWVEAVDGAAAVYFTVDDSTPAIGTDGSHYLPAAAGASIPFELDLAEQVTVKFKSSVAAKVSVRYAT